MNQQTILENLYFNSDFTTHTKDGNPIIIINGKLEIDLIKEDNSVEPIDLNISEKVDLHPDLRFIIKDKRIKYNSVEMVRYQHEADLIAQKLSIFLDRAERNKNLSGKEFKEIKLRF